MYVFDNSPLSVLFKNYYRKRFPTLWKNFDELVGKSGIVSTREVLREIEDSYHRTSRLGERERRRIHSSDG
jgi:Domain of unknown function (DUF4411)